MGAQFLLFKSKNLAMSNNNNTNNHNVAAVVSSAVSNSSSPSTQVNPLNGDSRLWWFRIATLLLESVPRVFRKLIHARYPACLNGVHWIQSPAGSVEETIGQLCYNVKIPVFVFESWEQEALANWDFSACWHAVVNTRIRGSIEPNTQYRDFRSAAEKLKNCRNKIAGHPSRCVISSTEYENCRDLIIQSVKKMFRVLKFDGSRQRNANLSSDFALEVQRVERLDLDLRVLKKLTVQMEQLDIRMVDFEERLLRMQHSGGCFFIKKMC